MLLSVRDHFKRSKMEEDRYDIIGKGFAVRLRDLEKKQRIIAEKLMNDVLFEAEMGSLTVQHKCISAEIFQQYPPSPYSQNSNYSTNSNYSEHSNSSYPCQGNLLGKDNFVHNTTHQQTQSNTTEKSTTAQYITNFINTLEN